MFGSDVSVHNCWKPYINIEFNVCALSVIYAYYILSSAQHVDWHLFIESQNDLQLFERHLQGLE